MAKKSLNGQISMFDFFRNLENDSSTNGEVEMVSLIPDEVIEEVETVEEEKIIIEDKEENGENSIQEEVDEETSLLKNDKVDCKICTGSYKSEDIVMQKVLRDKEGAVLKSISYVNYNKVVIVDKDLKENVYEFENSKNAVDFYIENINFKKKS